MRLFVNFGEMSCLVSKNNRKEQEQGLRLTGNFTEKGGIDENIRLIYM